MSTLPRSRKLVVFVAAVFLLFFSTPLTQAIAGEQLTLTPQTISFGNVPVGSRLTLPVTMSNTGTASLTITKRLKNAPGFSLYGIKYPTNLAVGQSLRFYVSFAPTSAGPVNGTYTFVSSTGGRYLLNVSGTGGGAGLAANPASLNFGNVQVGTKQSQLVAVTNSSSAALTIQQAAVTGTGYGISGLSTPTSVATGQSVTFTVTFSPPSSGTLNGNVGLTLANSNSGLSIPLTGTGAAAGQLAISPTSANFGTVTVGTSKNMPATLTASGATVTINSGSVINSEFSVSGLSLPITLAPGQSASFSLSFTPNASGTATGSASFVSNASNSPIQQSFAGTGSSPVTHSVSLSWNPDSSPVAGYNVYRGIASSGPYSRINTALDLTTAFNDGNVQSGQTYYYVVTAVNSSGLESGYSNWVQAVIP
jgi:Abnormal spindle-like microcephaly-assoc'd, ASPM-SPD-2-Hydin